MKYIAALLLCLSSTAIAQTVDSTGNIVDPTKWNNVIPMNGTQLSQVEGEGGGPIPALNTDTNTIRFSFFPYTVSQIIAINSVLSGQGISVGGFNYSWKIYNDLENCCGTRGTLVGNVNFFNNSGKVVESYTYDYSLTNTGADFKKFTGTETFNSPYQLNSLGDISVSWTGKDMNFWSGYYGPRVRDTEITLNYTVAQPTSPTIPTTTNTAISDVIAEVTSPTSSEPSTIQTVAQSTPVTEATTTTTNSTTTQPATTATQTTRESAPETQQSASPSLSSVLSMIQANQARENSIATTAVAQANQVAQQAVQQAEQTAIDVATTSSSQSIEISKTSMKTETKDTKSNSSNTGIPLVMTSGMVSGNINNQNQSVTALPQAASTSNLTNPSQQNIYSLANMSMQQIAGLPNNITNITIRPDTSIPTTPVQIVQEQPVVQLLPPTSPLSQTAVETPNSSSGLFTNRADPLQDYVEKNSIMVAMAQPEVKPTTVRANVQDNELAGGVRIERMASLPNGYNLYLSLILRDAAFYESKEIYKNNALKDNARTMYFIEKGNTDTFNKMIEAQYK